MTVSKSMRTSKSLRILASVLSCLVLLNMTSAQANAPLTKSHALIMYGTPKYPDGFKHFTYVNPDAPKDGTLIMGATGGFDSLNGYVLKGVPAAYINLLYDTLTERSLDEPFTEYGLLAESMERPADNSFIIFNLRKEARFHDGKPVTAADVVYSFNLLTSAGNPFYKAYYHDITKAEALDTLRVKFHFRDAKNQELPLIIGQMPVLPKHYWEARKFDDNLLDIPVGSGPYKIGNVKTGQSITYTLDKNYWGKDLPVNVGRYNFAKLRIDYYRDANVALEGFKAGNFDIQQETAAKRWATQYQGKNFGGPNDHKKFIVEEIVHGNPAGMQGFIFNIRKDLFSNPKVREALNLVFDFEWTNKNLFYGAYKRTDSYFENSELAAEGMPTAAELGYLNPLKDQIPARVFTTPYKNPTFKGDGKIRRELRQALKLLKEAGWQLKGGKLMNAKGKPFKFEILLYSKDFERVVLPFTRNLKKIGIVATPRIVDQSQYIKRRQNYDFDMMVNSFGQSISPGNEQRDYWFSGNADKKGSRNLIGIKNPAVDTLVEQLIAADSREALIAACRALDRVLLWNFYVIPNWHINSYRVARKSYIKRPDTTPQYGLGLFTWWIDKS